LKTSRVSATFKKKIMNHIQLIRTNCQNTTRVLIVVDDIRVNMIFTVTIIKCITVHKYFLFTQSHVILHYPYSS